MSIDCADFNITEHGTKWYILKFKKSGLRYEVGICIITGDIVWANGPYEPGVHNDIMIFRDSIKSHLGFAERVEADDGCIGEAHLCINIQNLSLILKKRCICNNELGAVKRGSITVSFFGE